VSKVSKAQTLRRRGLLLVAVVAVAAAALTAIQLWQVGTGVAGFRAALRATARLSVVLFVLAFVASSQSRLGWPGGKLLLRYRKYLGNAFAASHLVHLATIFGLIASHTATFTAERSLGSLVPGMITYSLIAAMVITSFRGPARALGRRRWVILHKIGMYAIWAVFLVSNAQKLATDALYAIPVAVLVLAVVLRGAARLVAIRRRKP
jgi:DMSO/TMAO reductase YedYZ heme-binding membrane subunit